MNIILMLFGHYLGDYLFQTDDMATEKKENLHFFIAHCLIYFFSILACSIFWGNFVNVLIISCIVGCSHAFIDAMKIYIKDKELLLYFVDQFLHITILIIIAQYMPPVNTIGLAIKDLILSIFPSLQPIRAGIIILGYLFCIQPAAVAVKILLEQINKYIIEKAIADNENKDDVEKIIEKATIANDKKNNNDNQKKISYIIGILERICILTLVLVNEYTAISFVLAAKSLGRIKELIKSEDFAEKYLVGTLFSFVLAILCGLVIKFVL